MHIADTFNALVLEQQDGMTQAAFKQLRTDDLPPGDVLVAVQYSSLNYKDGLAVTGRGKVVRSFPMVPGIDLAGVIEESSHPQFQPGDQVILTGWGVGERFWGGFAQRARVKGEWLLPLPAGLTLQRAMALGTAGLTAMLCVLALEEHGVTPDAGEVVVTGASGGVGSVAVAVLASLGYNVTASSGRGHEYLQSLGARQVIDRSVLGTPSKKPLESERWAGAVDTVGGETLAGVLRTMAYGGSAAACGLAGGNGLPTTVLPFILRAVNLLGIDSVMCPNARRQMAWQRLVHDLPLATLDQMTTVTALSDVPQLSTDILEGRVRGRVVVDVNS